MTISDNEAYASIQKLDEVLSQAETKTAGRDELCQVYRTAKPLLDRVLPVAERIPFIGKTIAKMIQVLTRIADVACPT